MKTLRKTLKSPTLHITAALAAVIFGVGMIYQGTYDTYYEDSPVKDLHWMRMVEIEPNRGCFANEVEIDDPWFCLPTSRSDLMGGWAWCGELGRSFTDEEIRGAMRGEISLGDVVRKEWHQRHSDL